MLRAQSLFVITTLSPLTISLYITLQERRCFFAVFVYCILSSIFGLPTSVYCFFLQNSIVNQSGYFSPSHKESTNAVDFRHFPRNTFRIRPDGLNKSYFTIRPYGGDH